MKIIYLIIRLYKIFYKLLFKSNFNYNNNQNNCFFKKFWYTYIKIQILIFIVFNNKWIVLIINKTLLNFKENVFSSSIDSI